MCAIVADTILFPGPATRQPSCDRTNSVFMQANTKKQMIVVCNLPAGHLLLRVAASPASETLSGTTIPRVRVQQLFCTHCPSLK